MLTPKNECGIIHHKSTVYGTSYCGIPLEIYLPQEVEPEILLLSGIHGDEADTTILLSEALRSIPIKELRSAAILTANPDGIVRGTRGNAIGVDLNRNFPTSNWSPDNVYYRTHKDEFQSIALSPGKKAGSEPETIALLNIIDQVKPKAIISSHSALACIDDPHGSKLGKWLSTVSGLPIVGDIGYPTPGSFGSWAGENVIPLVTLELPSEPMSYHYTHFTSMLIKLLRNDILL